MTVLVTGGCGFIGHHLVRRLLETGEKVMVLDNCFRGNASNLPDGVGFIRDDIRNEATVVNAALGADEIIHLAYINGTELFYKMPATVLDIAVRGMLSVIAACRKTKAKLLLFSSSEVCRAKLDMPDETIPLVIPDPFNPRYSYSAGKIISEMMAIHNAKYFSKLMIVRPFNIYGPGMSPGHVIPDFAAKFKQFSSPVVPFKMLGSGAETRSFCYIDDFIDGVMLMREKGEHMGIYNIGTPVETGIGELAYLMADIVGRKISLESGGGLREGDAIRRRPDISKIAALGYKPKVDLIEGLRRTMNA